MSIKYFADRVKETSITTGSGNIVLSGPTVGYYSFVNAIGENNRLTYYIYRQDTNFEWEIGIGYVFNSGGVHILVRERTITSSNNNNTVNFTAGTKYIEPVIGQERINAGLLNVSEQTGNFIADYVTSLHLIDASATGVQVSLPQVGNKNYPVTIGFVLNKTIGNQYSQPNAIVLSASGTETINGTGSVDISIRNDFLQIMSVPSQSGWVLLDPIQDSSNPYGNNGSIQVKYDDSFSGVINFNWDFINSALLIGGTGTITGADVIIPASGGNQTIVFNEQSYANDLRIEGTGNTHLFFVDGSENKLAINSSNATDSLTINAQYGEGITVYRSGVGPKLTIANSSVSGLATNDIIGTVIFSGLNNSGNGIEYAKLFTTIENTTNGSESADINMEIMKNGSLESVAVLGGSGITLGFNNSNLDGIIIGEVNQNEGNNIVLGYYQNICGDSCVAIGHNGSLASGSFGGILGVDHVSSGNNIWIIGGSGVSVSGNNKTYLAIDNNNYFTLDNSGSAVHATYSSGNQNLSLYNTYGLSSGINQNINFVFTNSSGIAKTGVILGSQIIDPTNTSEDTRIIGSILNNGSVVDVLTLDTNNINLGDNTSSGNNFIFGLDCSITGISNNIFGSGISSSGLNNTIIGNNIVNSGSSIVIVGQDILCESSGNFGITILGNNNIADEDYVAIFGHSNSASGLHAVAMGYLNGVHGEYSVGVGESNLILMDGAVSVGNNNSLSGLSIDATAFVVGIGNTINITNTGLSFGYDNEIYGSGACLLGESISSSGYNNIAIGKNISVTGINNIVIGNNRTVNDSGIIDIYADSSNGISVSSSGLKLESSVDFIFNNDVIVSGTGIFGSGILTSNINCSTITITGVGGIDNSGSLSVYGQTLFNDWVKVNSGLILNDMSTATGINHSGYIMPTGEDRMHKLMYQQDPNNTYLDSRVRYEPLASSGVLNTPLQLLASDAEYQFLYPTGFGTSYIYLPNGTGLYMGKKFTIANMDNSVVIAVRKSGEVSDLMTVYPLTNISLVHAGDNNWINITYTLSGTSQVVN